MQKVNLTPVGSGQINILDFADEVRRYTFFELEGISGYNNAGIKMIFDQIIVTPFLAPSAHLKSASGKIRVNHLDCDFFENPRRLRLYIYHHVFSFSRKEKFSKRYKLKYL